MSGEAYREKLVPELKTQNIVKFLRVRLAAKQWSNHQSLGERVGLEDSERPQEWHQGRAPPGTA